MEYIRLGHDLFYLFLSISCADGQRLLGLSAAGKQPLAQALERRRHDRHKVRVRKSCIELHCALDVNVEQRDHLVLLNLHDLLLRRAIHVRMHLAMLDELIISYHLLEDRMRHKVVVCAIDFALSWRPRRVGHAELELAWIGRLGQVLNQGALPDT